MTSKTHDLAAMTLLGVVCILHPVNDISVKTATAAVLANLIGGIAPDIDQPTAPLWRNLPIGSFFGRIFGKMAGGHRFFTHSILGLGAMGYALHLVLAFFNPVLGGIDRGIVWWAFMIGAFSHLLMDSLTKEGVPWLLPIPVKFGMPPIKAWRITTGHWVENFIVFPGLMLFNLYFLSSNNQKIIEIIKHRIF